MWSPPGSWLDVRAPSAFNPADEVASATAEATPLLPALYPSPPLPDISLSVCRLSLAVERVLLTLCDVQTQICAHRRFGPPAHAQFYCDQLSEATESDEEYSLPSNVAEGATELD